MASAVGDLMFSLFSSDDGEFVGWAEYIEILNMMVEEAEAVEFKCFFKVVDNSDWVGRLISRL